VPFQLEPQPYSKLIYVLGSYGPPRCGKNHVASLLAQHLADGVPSICHRSIDTSYLIMKFASYIGASMEELDNLIDGTVGPSASQYFQPLLRSLFVERWAEFIATIEAEPYQESVEIPNKDQIRSVVLEPIARIGSQVLGEGIWSHAALQLALKQADVPVVVQVLGIRTPGDHWYFQNLPRAATLRIMVDRHYLARRLKLCGKLFSSNAEFTRYVTNPWDNQLNELLFDHVIPNNGDDFSDEAQLTYRMIGAIAEQIRSTYIHMRK
jgi:hypothetical protein